MFFQCDMWSCDSESDWCVTVWPWHHTNPISKFPKIKIKIKQNKIENKKGK